jgi:hypothetical protein
VKQALVVLGLFIVGLYARVSSAAPIFKDEEKGITVNVDVLVQPTFQMTMPGSNGGGPGPCGSEDRNRCSAGIGNARGDGPAYDFFLRRTRLRVWGTATKDLAYFADTDEPNIGKGGNFAVSPGTYIQDAFLSYTVIPEFKVDAGLMLVPLSHHTLEGANSLNALDYHSDLIKFPAGRVFRDTGVQFRGIALMDHLHYRLGIFEGGRNTALPALPAATATQGAPTRTTLNPGSVPRFTAHLRGNILGSEPDFFMKGIYFTEKPIVSVGVGADFQPNGVIMPDGSHGHYLAGSFDVFADYPLTKVDEIIFKGNFFVWGKGQGVAGTLTTVGAVAGAAGAPGPGGRVQAGGPTAYGAKAFYVEAGFRHDFIEPILFFEVLKGNRETVSLIAPHAGVNLWVMKHDFNVKTDFGYRRTERKAETTLKDIIWTTQAQLFF